MSVPGFPCVTSFYFSQGGRGRGFDMIKSVPGFPSVMPCACCKIEPIIPNSWSFPGSRIFPDSCLVFFLTRAFVFS